MAKQRKQLTKAWLVSWGFYGSNQDESLKRYGIEKSIVDFFSSRKTFGFICEFVKGIYRIQRLSFSEKIDLEHYRNGRKNSKEVFGRAVPVSTHFQTETYRELVKECEKDMKSREAIKLIEQWKKCPKYIVVGHNPYLKAEEVYNLKIVNEPSFKEILEWEEVLADGVRKNRKCST